MARYPCPSCGASWNGKHCRACHYGRFPEEIAHRSHTHKGEPLLSFVPQCQDEFHTLLFETDPSTREISVPEVQSYEIGLDLCHNDT